MKTLKFRRLECILFISFMVMGKSIRPRLYKINYYISMHLIHFVFLRKRDVLISVTV